MSSTTKVSDDHGNHRLSAVRNGPAAGLGEMGPRETTFTYVDPAANGEMGPHEGFNTSAVPNPIATMDEDRVPLRDQGTPLLSRGQYSPDNITTPHAQTELFVIHGSMSVCANEDDSESECGSDRESGSDACLSDHNSGPEDERDNTDADVHIADDQDHEDRTSPRLADTYDQGRTSHVAESLHPGGIKRRSSSTLHLARAAPITT
jgi:hypothetical protein